MRSVNHRAQHDGSVVKARTAGVRALSLTYYEN